MRIEDCRLKIVDLTKRADNRQQKGRRQRTEERGVASSDN
jgi:hypothetical protein